MSELYLVTRGKPREGRILAVFAAEDEAQAFARDGHVLDQVWRVLGLERVHPSEAEPESSESHRTCIPPHANREAHEAVMQRLRAMTPREIVDTATAIGIYDADGNITPEYGGDHEDLSWSEEEQKALDDAAEEFAKSLTYKPEWVAALKRAAAAGDPPPCKHCGRCVFAGGYCCLPAAEDAIHLLTKERDHARKCLGRADKKIHNLQKSLNVAWDQVTKARTAAYEEALQAANRRWEKCIQTGREEGAAVAFGIMGMAHALYEKLWRCDHCHKPDDPNACCRGQNFVPVNPGDPWICWMCGVQE